MCAMKHDKGEESGEMYSLNDQVEYTPKEGVAHFSAQGLTDVLTTIELTVVEVQLPHREFAMQLEVMMADHTGHPHPHILVEYWYGDACAQEQSYAEGAITCVGGWAGDGLSVFYNKQG